MDELPTQDEVNQFLDHVRELGVFNMFGAGNYIQEQFDIGSKDATRFLSEWMSTFEERQDA